MKKLLLIVSVLSHVLASPSYAELDTNDPMSSLVLTTFLPALPIIITVGTALHGKSKAQIFRTASFGASRLTQIQSQDEALEVIKADANLQVALAVLHNEGFAGTVQDAGYAILNNMN